MGILKIRQKKMTEAIGDAIGDAVGVLVEPCDPEIENCKEVFLEEVVNQGTLEWLVILYIGQILAIPILSVLNAILSLNILKLWFLGPLFQLHMLAYLPSVVISYLYLIYGKDQDNQSLFTQLLDEASIWFIALWTANIGLFAHSLTGSWLLFTWLRNFKSPAQFVKSWGYIALATY